MLFDVLRGRRSMHVFKVTWEVYYTPEVFTGILWSEIRKAFKLRLKGLVIIFTISLESSEFALVSSKLQPWRAELSWKGKRETQQVESWRKLQARELKTFVGWQWNLWVCIPMKHCCMAAGGRHPSARTVQLSVKADCCCFLLQALKKPLRMDRIHRTTLLTCRGHPTHKPASVPPQLSRDILVFRF